MNESKEEFNSWLVMLPSDDFLDDHRKAIPVKWDEESESYIVIPEEEV